MLGGVRVGGGAGVVVMGVLNVSPESFYAASVHQACDDVTATATAMVGAGAAVVDVGGMSTAPYRATRIGEDEEASRLARAVGALARHVTVPISVDTARPGPAHAAFGAGACVLNDVTGLADDRVAALAAERGVSVILMASPAGARAAGIAVDPGDPIGTVRACLEASLARAAAAGIPADRTVLDPGIGFFLEEATARAAWDVRVLGALAELQDLGRPLCVGVSRKSFIGAITGRERPDDRLAGSLAATVLAVGGGAALVRTHDVAETRDAVLVAEHVIAFMGGLEGPAMPPERSRTPRGVRGRTRGTPGAARPGDSSTGSARGGRR
ncbi:MAG: dihydropteroate synthase [Candidatus Rokubacteria bacterium]|nr:dihydropteroate synthase [Candidatus Rokubacteria bacterium]